MGSGALVEEMRFAMEIARRAGRTLLDRFDQADLEVRPKGERDVVTSADLEAEAFLKQSLQERFPEDGFIGEESAGVAGAGVRRWLVDPLDGTLNYSRGLPVWSVSLALFSGDAGLVGVVHDPVRNETFHGAHGLGAFLNGTPIQTTGLEDLERAFVHLTVDFNDQSRREGLADMNRLAPLVLRTRNIGSAALGLAYVAAGRFDAMLHRHANAWDYGAGSILVLEAGGAVSDMHGNPWQAGKASIAAAAGDRLRSRLLDALRADATVQLQ